MIAQAWNSLARSFKGGERRYDALSRFISSSDWFGTKSNAGTVVTAKTALENSSVWKGLSLISGDVSTMPLIMYRRTEEGKEKAVNHPNYALMRWKTGALTANIWKRRTVAQLLLYGNSYSKIERKGRKVSLTLLHPDKVKVEEAAAGDGSLVYILGKAPNEQKIPAADMFHIQGISTDVYGGLSLVEFARQTIGRHLAAEGFTDDFFANGVMKSGWFKLPVGMTMSPEAQDRFLSQHNTKTAGKRHSMGILEDGMEWMPSGVSPRDAMMIEMLQLTPYDVARYFNLPPHKLGIQGMATQSNTSEENGDYYKSTLPPILNSIECECWDKILREDEKTDEVGGLYYEFLMDSIMRASTLERYQIYRLAISSRIMNPNECRAKENMNEYEGGDQFENPYTTSGANGQNQPSTDPQVMDGGRNPVSPDSPDGTSPQTNSLRSHVHSVVQEAVLRCAKRLTHAGEQAAKNPDKYLTAMESVREGHGATVREWLRKSVALSAAVDGEADVEERLDAVVESLFLAFHDHFLAAADVQPQELAVAVRNASERLLASAGALSADLCPPVCLES